MTVSLAYQSPGSYGTSSTPVAPVNAGDVLVLVFTNDAGVGAASVSGGGVNVWNKANTDGLEFGSSIWYGNIVTPGSSNIDVTLASGANFAGVLLGAYELTCGSPASWQPVVAGGVESATAVGYIMCPPATMPGADDLYFALAVSSTSQSSFNGAGTWISFLANAPYASVCYGNWSSPAAVQASVTLSSAGNTDGAAVTFGYTPEQTVTFDANGGTGTMAPEQSSVAAPLTFNAFVNPGYVFGSWNTIAGGGGTSYGDGATYPFTASATLYAQWIIAYTVTFDPNGGTGTMGTETGALPFALAAIAYTRAGFTFTGWNTAPDGSGTAYANGATYDTSANVTLYAQWSANTYTVTFNANGGVGTMATEAGILPFTLTPNAFTRSGYNFVSWNTAANGSGTSFTDQASYNVASNNTLYAQWSVPTAPAAPTLVAPANSSYLDVVNGITFGPVDYNSTDGNGQNAYALRVKVSSGIYNYWNASTNALQSTIVWNADTVPVGGSWSVTIPAGVLADGNIYNWSMASQELTGLQGAFAADFTFTAQAGPVVTISAPTGTVTVTTQPVVDWSVVFPSGAAQTGYEVIVESGAYTTVPGTGVQEWSSGAVSSTATNTTVGVPLPSPGTYRVFVQATETGSEVSAWAYSTFTLNANAPATPILVGTPGDDAITGAPRVLLQLQALDNLLTENQGSLESGATTGWTAGANTTTAASTTWAMDGIYSLELTATAAGAVAASTPSGTSGIPVLGGETVRAMGFFHSPATVRAATVAITFYNSAGAVLSSVTSTATNSTLTGAGGQAFVTTTAPLLSATMSVTIGASGLAASEAIYVDNLFVGPGASTVWTAGGFTGVSTVTFMFSDDGVNWFAVRGGSALPVPALGQQVAVVDYEGSLGFPRQYQAQVVAP